MWGNIRIYYTAKSGAVHSHCERLQAVECNNNSIQPEITQECNIYHNNLRKEWLAWHLLRMSPSPQPDTLSPHLKQYANVLFRFSWHQHHKAQIKRANNPVLALNVIISTALIHEMIQILICTPTDKACTSRFRTSTSKVPVLIGLERQRSSA